MNSLSAEEAYDLEWKIVDFLSKYIFQGPNNSQTQKELLNKRLKSQGLRVEFD